MKKTFTLLEVLIVTVIASMVLVIVIQLYQTMIQTKINVAARQALIKNSYYFLERLNQQISNYTIDYEEYFNRAVVGCDSDGIGNGGGFSRDVDDNGKCDRFTSYGNKFLGDQNWNLYYCSSISIISNDPNNIVYNINTSSWNGCWDSHSGSIIFGLGAPHRGAKPQPYGEYKEQFWDYRGDADGFSGIVFDDDDVDLGEGPKAIWDANNVKELYLVSQDGTQRLFFRLARVASGDWNGNGISGDSLVENLYTFQILKLKGFDAGIDHNFDTINDGAYDGKIDTWACDYSQGFVCKGIEVRGVYTNYKLPNDQDDGWVNFFGKSITITGLKMQIYPVKDPALAWIENQQQISPYIKIKFTSNLYGEPWFNKLNPAVLEKFKIDLQTTFNIREYY